MAQLNNPLDPMEGTLQDPVGNQLPVSDTTGHLVQIVSDAMQIARLNPDHGMLVLNLQILEGEFAGIVGAYRLNLFNTNPTAVEIAERDLKSVAIVCGVFNTIVDTSVLFNRPFRVLVRQQKKDPQYTEVYGVLSTGGMKPNEVKAAGPQTAVGLPPAAPAVAPPAGLPPAAPAVAPPAGLPPAAPAVAPPAGLPPAAPAVAPPAGGQMPWGPQPG